MARLPNLTCYCGAFPMVDDTHEILHGNRFTGAQPGPAKHTAVACDEDHRLAPGQAKNRKTTAVPETPRVFRLSRTP